MNNLMQAAMLELSPIPPTSWEAWLGKGKGIDVGPSPPPFSSKFTRIWMEGFSDDCTSGYFKISEFLGSPLRITQRTLLEVHFIKTNFKPQNLPKVITTNQNFALSRFIILSFQGSTVRIIVNIIILSDEKIRKIRFLRNNTQK